MIAWSPLPSAPRMLDPQQYTPLGAIAQAWRVPVVTAVKSVRPPANRRAADRDAAGVVSAGADRAEREPTCDGCWRRGVNRAEPAADLPAVVRSPAPRHPGRRERARMRQSRRDARERGAVDADRAIGDRRRASAELPRAIVAPAHREAIVGPNRARVIMTGRDRVVARPAGDWDRRRRRQRKPVAIAKLIRGVLAPTPRRVVERQAARVISAGRYAIEDRWDA